MFGVKVTIFCFYSSVNFKVIFLKFMIKPKYIKLYVGFNANSSGRGLVVKALDFQSRGPAFKSTRWLQVQLSLSSFQGQSVDYQELLGTKW